MTGAKKPRSLLLISIPVGVLSLALAGAICGYTGLLHTEYHATPRDQAILVGIGGAEWGLVLGLVFGLLATFVRRLWRGRGRP